MNIIGCWLAERSTVNSGSILLLNLGHLGHQLDNVGYKSQITYIRLSHLTYSLCFLTFFCSVVAGHKEKKNSGHQSQGGLRAWKYMTAVFTHIWFSKWISLSLHYWSESQYNECLPWRWHRGGLIIPHFPKWAYLKYYTFCFRDPDCGTNAHARVCACTYVNCVFERVKSNKSFYGWVEPKLWPHEGLSTLRPY